eukprot:TRINITY_DN8502_c0_g4_i2.p1 TRINITY_DN8502_c0_g4~~TRINITY_DN8502_c0_g4_i2.p1  ORF type:complete len:281 (-),score=48.87 TRINITY_DN8502_c0_g4_i2:71-913(-)
MASTSAAPQQDVSPQGESERPLRYRKLEKIGDGGSASVFKGLDLDTKKFIAIKQVRSSPSTSSDWETEVASLRKLSHPNIVRYLGTDREGANLNILLEYAPGGSVAAQLKAHGSLSEEIVRRYTKEMLQGLDYVHQNKIIHRDIKGANLLLDANGTVKLADFGASKIFMNPDGTPSADFFTLKGTLSWMAPEVVKMTGHRRRADIWSVGITVWEMLCGKPPYAFSNKQSGLYNIGTMTEAPQAPAELSADAQNFINSCLKLSPSERPSVKQLLQCAAHST